MQTLKAILSFLEGKKTYISMLILAIYGVVKAFGVNLTSEQDTAILSLIGALFGFGLGSKVDRLGAIMGGKMGNKKTKNK